MKVINSIHVLGEIKPDNDKNYHSIQNRVYDVKGLCPTLNGRDYKDPRKILVRSEDERKQKA